MKPMLGLPSDDDEQYPAIRAREAGEQGDIETLLTFLSSTDRLRRIYGVVNLGRTKDPRAIPALIRCLSSSDERLRIGALKSLANIGDASIADEVFIVATSED